VIVGKENRIERYARLRCGFAGSGQAEQRGCHCESATKWSDRVNVEYVP
jgi:hypothetical protein